MARKVIIDCDMGSDDAVALCMLLFDNRVDVLAITAVEGCVPAKQANQNLQAIVSMLDPDRYPRLGMATKAENAPAVDTRFLYGDDGLGNADFDVSTRQHEHASDKLIIDLVRANPEEVTILCLGPSTNLARALRREPSLATMIDRVIMTGGSLTASGNITPTAEFNFYFDPQAASDVFKARTTNMLIPLDVTEQVRFGLGLMDDIPKESTRVGYFLRQVLPYSFRAYRQQLGLEQIPLNDSVGALALLEPDLFTFEEMAGDVEIEGQLTRGVLCLDRRPQREWRRNINVANEIRPTAAQYIIDQLTLAGNKTA
jgi:purine nucleosidase